MRWEGGIRTPIVEHEAATDAQILEATLMGYRVERNALASDLYPWMLLPPDRAAIVFNRYYTEREAWSAAWLLLRHREGVEA